ncbi:hypothetical protein HNW13_018195 [Shewanella sp. BF02_Schw]|uniref:hypothetical protein n=1 Tax=Shewanella sp. BF02_Schw TaxID=394908 RepID=UPI00177AC9BE|nr:hypothetical protein [Shewanella sp. BF02_Schw]MBO1897672.1 hypothetical protein [Shewanella sp. BF02_Schw]
MTKERASGYLLELRSKGHNIQDTIEVAKNPDIPTWQRAETIVNEVSNCASQGDIKFLISNSIESIHILRDELIHSRQARKTESPPTLGVWLLSSQIKSSAGLSFLRVEGNVDSMKKNIIASSYNPLSKRCEFNDENGIEFLLFNDLYRNDNDLQKAYIEFIASISTEPEQSSQYKLIHKFTNSLAEPNSIKVYGKSVLDFLGAAGHERTASLLFSEIIDREAEIISRSVNKDKIEEFTQSINNSL